MPEGGYRPVLTKAATGVRLAGPDFQGTAGSKGAEVTLTLDLAAVGFPRTVAVRASGSRTHSGATGGDEAPDAGTETLTLSTGC